MTDYIAKINIGTEVEIYNGAFQVRTFSHGVFQPTFQYYALIDLPQSSYDYPMVNLVVENGVTNAYLVCRGDNSFYGDTSIFYGVVKSQTASTLEIVRYDYPVGGDIFQGEFVAKNVTIRNNDTLNANSVYTYSLSSYLPNDGYDYEVLFGIDVQTNATSGNDASCFLITDYGQSEYWYYGGQINTRANSINLRYTNAWGYIPASNKTIALKNDGSYSSKIWVNARGYRRLNSNHDTDHIRYVTAINGTDIGGNNFDGSFFNIGSTIDVGTLGEDDYFTIDLSSIIPNDGYHYMVYGDLVATTTATSGESARLALQSSIMTAYVFACASKANTNATMTQTSAFAVPVGYAEDGYDHIIATLKVINLDTAVGTSGTITLRLRYARRIGTNE